MRGEKKSIPFVTAFGIIGMCLLVAVMQLEPMLKGDGCSFNLNSSFDDPVLLSCIHEHYLIAPSEKPYQLASRKERIYSVMVHNIKGDFLKHYASQLFSDLSHGFFVEAGALDGEFLSNTLWLEQERGWTGLLVEPNPVSFQHLRRKHRKAWLSSCCLSTDGTPKTIVIESFHPESLDTEFLLTKWLYYAQARDIESPLFSHEDSVTMTSENVYFKAQCFPLASLLLVLNVKTVDFLSLDTQGGEWGILRTLSTFPVSLRVIFVEHYLEEEPITDFDREFANFMMENGYYILDFENGEYIFILGKDKEMRQKIRGGSFQKYSKNFTFNIT